MNAILITFIIGASGMIGVIALSFFERRRGRVVAPSFRVFVDTRIGSLSRRARFSFEQMALGRGGFARARAFGRIIRRRIISVAKEIRLLMNHVPQRLIAAALGRRSDTGRETGATASAFLRRVSEYKQRESA